MLMDYRPDLEEIAEDEAEIFEGIADAFRKMGEKVMAEEGRALRVSHAKSTGLLTGTLIVDADLPPALAQGLCAAPAEYEVLVRLAQGPGEMLHDRVSTHRGMAVKILGVEGARIPESREDGVQDWLLEAGKPSFINSNARTFLANLKAGVSHAPDMAEGVKAAVSGAARALNAPLEALGIGSKTLAFFGHPPRHPLAESYFSQVPLRWGRHVAKIGVFPSGGLLEQVEGVEIDNAGDFDAFRAAVIDHFSAHGAVFDLRVQLATTDMPIEDAATAWSEEDSPYASVARLVLPPQEAWTEAKSALFDEGLSFQPANSLAAHRPLGQVMRARLFVYDRLARFRQAANGVARRCPVTAAKDATGRP